MPERWRELLHQLTCELEDEFARLRGDSETLYYWRADSQHLQTTRPEPKPLKPKKRAASPDPGSPSALSVRSDYGVSLVEIASPSATPGAWPGSWTSSVMAGILRRQPTATASLSPRRSKKVLAMPKAWYIINPEHNNWLSSWHLATAAALVFVALVTPLQIGLLEARIDALAICSFLVDLMFFIDLVLNFFIAFPSNTPHGVVWETRLSKIGMKYLKGWFPIDFLTLLPFDLLGLAMDTESIGNFKVVRVLRVLRLVKLVRLCKSWRLLRRWEIPYSIPYRQLALLRFLMVIMVMCHWLACVWAMTLQLVDPGVPRWLDDIESEIVFGIKTEESPFSIYIASFYFCSYTMTSVGYGDFGPKNLLERCVCTLMVIGSGLCWAYVLGEVCAIVAEMNADSRGFRNKMQELNKLMKERGLPSEMKSRLRSFFLQNRDQVLYVSQKKLLGDLSPQLKAEVCTELNLPWIKKVGFFKRFLSIIRTLEARGMSSEPFQAAIADISSQLEMAAFAQREFFQSPQVLYILSKGLVTLNGRFAPDGAVWGEDFVLSDVSLIRPVAGYALTYVEVLHLSHHSFMEVIERRKWTCPQLGQIVRHHCIRIAVARGIMKEARRRQACLRKMKK